jgi:nitroreductase
MRRLDPTREVSDADLLTVVEAATKAANGGNNQRTRWLVVRDRAKRKRLGEIYRECITPVMTAWEAKGSTDPAERRVIRSSWYLADHMGDAPAIILACGPENTPASIYPGVQNLFLAARALGLGTTLTTMHRQNETAVKELLDIPVDIATYCMIPVGYPLGRWGEAPRRPVRELSFWDAWGRTPS